MLPQCNPEYKTVHRWLQQWCEREVLRRILTQLANTSRGEGDIAERESFIERQIIIMKSRWSNSASTFPCRKPNPSTSLAIGPLTAMGSIMSIKQDGVNMIAPHLSTRTLKTQDGRCLRRYQRRWVVERFFAWLQWKRLLVIRWEYYGSNFLGFGQLACITTLLKQC